MSYKTFKTTESEGLMTVTFDNPPVNIQDIPMINDLTALANSLENNKDIKVVVFESANPEIFIAHADVTFLKDLSTTPVPKSEVKLSNLQIALDKISKLPQATIAKIEGFCRGGGNEFALACDMRFAARTKAVFMQMEVGFGVLPCGGGTSRLAKIVGLGNALEMILSARDFDADEAEKIGLVNKTLDPDKIGPFVTELATRISKFPSESINACKKTIHASVNMTTDDCLYEEAYELYQATSQTPAIKRFTNAYETNFQNSMENQRNFQSLLMDMQSIK